MVSLSLALGGGPTDGKTHFATLISVLATVHFGRRLIANIRAFRD